jgi:hypothetical protein
MYISATSSRDGVGGSGGAGYNNNYSIPSEFYGGDGDDGTGNVNGAKSGGKGGDGGSVGTSNTSCTTIILPEPLSNLYMGGGDGGDGGRSGSCNSGSSDGKSDGEGGAGGGIFLDMNHAEIDAANEIFIKGGDSGNGGNIGGAGGTIVLDNCNSFKASNLITIQGGTGGSQAGGAVTLNITGDFESGNNINITAGAGGIGSKGGDGYDLRASNISVNGGNSNNGGDITLTCDDIDASILSITGGAGGKGGNGGHAGMKYSSFGGGDGGNGGNGAVASLTANTVTVRTVNVTSGLNSTGGNGYGGNSTQGLPHNGKAGGDGGTGDYAGGKGGDGGDGGGVNVTVTDTLVAPTINLTKNDGYLSFNVGSLNIVENTTITLKGTDYWNNSDSTGVNFETINVDLGKTLTITDAGTPHEAKYTFGTVNLYGYLVIDSSSTLCFAKSETEGNDGSTIILGPAADFGEKNTNRYNISRFKSRLERRFS